MVTILIILGLSIPLYLAVGIYSTNVRLVHETNKFRNSDEFENRKEELTNEMNQCNHIRCDYVCTCGRKGARMTLDNYIETPVEPVMSTIWSWPWYYTIGRLIESYSERMPKVDEEPEPDLSGPHFDKLRAFMETAQNKRKRETDPMYKSLEGHLDILKNAGAKLSAEDEALIAQAKENIKDKIPTYSSYSSDFLHDDEVYPKEVLEVD